MSKVPPPPCPPRDKKGNPIVDPYAAKLDMCITDGIVKTGGGLMLGALSSVLFLKRKRWPLIAGMGIGIGIAYANCETELNSPNKPQHS